MKSVVLLSLLFSFAALAQQGNDQRTVSDCAKDLKIKIWWDSKNKNAEKYCEDHSQVTIDCAINLMQAKHITYNSNFEKALKDCNRTRK